MSLARHAVALLVALTLLSPPTRAQQPPAANEPIEAKWGQAWYPAAILKRDGDKVFVRFDDGIQKWLPLTDTRPRAKTGGPGPGAAAAGEPAQPAAPATPKFPEIGSLADAKWFDRWEAATIVKKEGNRFYIKYHDGIHKWLTRAELRPLQPTTPGAQKLLGLPATPANAPGAKPTAQAPDKPALPPLPQGDTSAAKKIEPANAPYTAKPDPAPQPVPALNTSAAIPLNLKLSADVPPEEVSRMLFTPGPSPTAWLVTHQREFFDKPQRSQIQRVDLALGRQLDVLQVPPDRAPLDVSDDGTLLLARARHPDTDGKLAPSDRSGALEVLRRDNNTLTPLTTWQMTTEWHVSVTGAAFVGNDHVLSWRSDGLTTLWKLPQSTGVPAAVYTIQLGHLLQPTFSPGGKTFLADHQGKLAFFDTLTGAPLGAVADFQLPGPASAAFKPDGVLLAVASTQRVTIVNVPGGKIFREIPIPKPYDAHTSVDWVAPNHLLLGRRYLVDILKRVITWEYEFPARATGRHFAGRGFFVTNTGKGARADTSALRLASTPLPHDAALKAQPAVNADDLLVLKPGVKVTIDLNTPAPEDVRKKIQKSLEDQARALGMEIADNQPLRITASSTDENSRQVTYRLFGGGQQTANVSDKVHTLTITLDGAELWKTTARSTPSPFVSTKKDQTIEDAIRQTQEQSYTYLTTMRLPQVLAKSDPYPLAGRTTVTDKGPTDGPHQPPQPK